MKCIYCEGVFKPTKLTKVLNICPECDGTVDDLDIPDSEIQLEISSLRNPSGRTKPQFEDEEE